MEFLLLLALAQDDVAELIRRLEDDRLEIREKAEQRLLEIGEKALTALKGSSHPHARALAARIEWAPYVPLWVEAKDPGIFVRLASEDGGVAAAAYDQIVRSGGLRLFLDAKIARDGPIAAKRRVLAGFDATCRDPARVSILLDLLAGWDTSKAPLGESDLKGPIEGLIRHVRPRHQPRLRDLAGRDDPLLRLAGRLGLALLGDDAALKTILEELRGSSSWRCVAAAEVFGERTCPDAEPLLRGLLDRTDASILAAALRALEAYPSDRLREPLVRLLTYANEKPEARASVQAGALHLLAVCRIDESKRIWELFQEGNFANQSRGAQWTTSWDRAPADTSVECRLAEALLVPDDPACLDKLENLNKDFWWTYLGVKQVLFWSAPPKVAARLVAIEKGTERATPFLLALAKDYMEDKRRNIELPPVQAVPFLEQGGDTEMMRTVLRRMPARLPDDLKKRLSDLCRGWLKDPKHPLWYDAAVTLHELGIKEGTDVLLDLSKPDTREAMSSLYQVYRDERARPLLHAKLKSQHEDVRISALGKLALLKDEAVPPVVLEMFREKKHQTFGDGLVYFLKHYSRDFTEGLLPFLNDSTPTPHLEQILEYLRFRGRKDQLKRVRPYLTHKDNEIRRKAASILAEWRDKESYETLTKQLESSSSEHDWWNLLPALAGIDPERTRPRLRAWLEDPDEKRRSTAGYVLDEIAGPSDRHIILRIIRTQRHYRLPRTAGRLGGPGVAEALLLLAENGEDAAALGLAYLGERRAVPILIEHLDDLWGNEFITALDYIANRSHYPPLSERKTFPRSLHYFGTPFEDGRRLFRERFGVDLAHSELIDPETLDFGVEDDLLEFLERNTDRNYFPSYYAHLWRNGRIELVQIDEARKHWKAWWAEHAREYK